MKKSSLFYLGVFLVFNYYTCAAQIDTTQIPIYKPTVAGLLFEQEKFAVKKLKLNREVGKEWVRYYDRINCWFDYFNDVSIGISRNGKSIDSHTYEVTYEETCNLLNLSQTRKAITYYFVIKTKPSDIDKNNESQIDDYQYAIATQSNQLLILNEGIIVEILNLNKVQGALGLFTGKMKNGNIVTIKMNECVILN